MQTHPISSALSLIGVMGSLAVLYLLLGAEFIAAAQLIVYAGAIMVLFVFVIMLLNAGAERRRGKTTSRPSGWVSRCWSCFWAWSAIIIQATASRTRRRALRQVSPAAPRQRHRHASCSPHTCCPSKSSPMLILIAIFGAIVLARKEIE